MNIKNLFFILITYLFCSTTIFSNMVDQYLSLQANLDLLSRIMPAAKPSLKPTLKPGAIEIKLSNINFLSPDAKNKDAFVKALENFSRTDDAKKEPSVIAKIKSDVIELLKIDKNLIDQAEKILVNIGLNQAQIDKEIASFKKTKSTTVVKAPTATSAINISMPKHIQFQLGTVLGMNKTAPADREARRDKANEYINVLEEYVKKDKDKLLSEKGEIEAVAKKILGVTPLTISTVVKTLANVGFDQSYIYKLIIVTYEKQIDFIKSEKALGSTNISEKGKLPEQGPCDDISDALSYAIAISSEIIPLKTKLDVEGKSGLSNTEYNFLNKITELQAGFDEYLTKSSENIKKAFAKCTGLSVEEYSKMIKISRPVFCRLEGSEYEKLQREECSPYISFYGLLESIDNLITAYTKGTKLTKIQKTDIQQKIVNQLNHFIYYNAPSAKERICPNCLRRDVFRWVKGKEHFEDSRTVGPAPEVPKAHPEYDKDLDAEFKKITDFFTRLPLKEKNSSTETGIALANSIREILRNRFADLDNIIKEEAKLRSYGRWW